MKRRYRGICKEQRSESVQPGVLGYSPKACGSEPCRNFFWYPLSQHAFIPVGAAWLNLIEGWWRIFRRKAFAGQSLADDHDIAYVTRIATDHRGRHAKPWLWGRPPTK